jgi:excisionase family DNA binding protein
MIQPGEIEALAVPAKKAAFSIGVGMTRLYELINSGEIESYRDGKARKIVVASLKAYVERQVAAEPKKPREGWTDQATTARIAKKNVRDAIRPVPAKARGL